MPVKPGHYAGILKGVTTHQGDRTSAQVFQTHVAVTSLKNNRVDFLKITLVKKQLFPQTIYLQNLLSDQPGHSCYLPSQSRYIFKHLRAVYLLRVDERMNIPSKGAGIYTHELNMSMQFGIKIPSFCRQRYPYPEFLDIIVNWCQLLQDVTGKITESIQSNED